MKANCELCGQLIQSRHIPGMEPEDVELFKSYDSLAAQMWLHISNSHRNQTEEGIVMQQRAAKMYAMNWAVIAPELEQARRHYREQMLLRMASTTEFHGDRQAGGAAAVASSGADSSDASNVKKSSRNVSN